MQPLAKPLAILSWFLQLIAAFIIGQTLFFKLTGAPETIALFEVVGGEPFMRYATALLELVAVVLLVIPRTAPIGGLAAVVVMTGAIGAHATKLGISIDPEALGNPDLEPLAGPSLFVMAVVAWVSGAAVAVIRRRQLPVVGARFGAGPGPDAKAGEAPA
jgi:uncharacterized membrane protein YphA (DoxX/SURF4 family)